MKHIPKQSTAIETDYLSSVFTIEKFKKTVDKTAKDIRKFYCRMKDEGKTIESIAFRGTSGAAVAYPLSYKLGLPLTCIRRGITHSSRRIEGVTNPDYYIIVDDFIDSGHTVNAIRKAVKNEWKAATCLGIFLYHKHAAASAFTEYKNIPVYNTALRA